MVHRGHRVFFGKPGQLGFEQFFLQIRVVEFEDIASASARADRSRAGSTWWLADLEFLSLPETSRAIAELGRFASISSADLSTEGLPGRFTGVVVDGIGFTSAMHPGLPNPLLRTSPLPRSAFHRADLLTNGLDVEWSEYAGAVLSAHPGRGARRFEARAFGDWSGDALASSRYFDPEEVRHNSLRGGLLVRGPVIQDSASFVVGVEVRRIQQPRPRAWSTTAVDSALVAIASDSFAVDLTPYLGPGRLDADVLSAFGAFDWRLSGRHGLSVRGSATTFSVSNPELGMNRVPGLGSELEGHDVSAGATLTAQFTPFLAAEFRTGIELSRRTYTETQPPATILADGPMAFGSDPTLPGEFGRFGFRGSAALHFQVGRHRLKLGGSAVVASLDHAYAFGRTGEFFFAGVDEFARLEGVFVQSVGSLPVARLSSTTSSPFSTSIGAMPSSGLDSLATIRSSPFES